jgi:hypothetical protein
MALESYDEQPVPYLDSEVLDFVAASESSGTSPRDASVKLAGTVGPRPESSPRS